MARRRMGFGRKIKDEPVKTKTNRGEFDANSIAETMSLSPRTVGTHLYNIKQKLSASNSAELTLIALRAGLLEN